MKKIAAIFLLTVYVNTAFGTAINFNYCKEHLTKVVVLNFGGDDGCNCNPKEVPKDCCKDRLKHDKADNHNIVQAVQISELIYLSVEPSLEYTHATVKVIEGSVIINPPDKGGYPDPIFLFIRVFRI